MSNKIQSFFSEIGGSVQDGDAIATALFIIEMFFMFDWLFSAASPVPSIATAQNASITAAFFPLLIVIIPVTIFGILKNMLQGKEAVTREAFSLTPRILVQIQTKAANFTARQEAKRQFYKRYGRATRYRRVQPKEKSEESE